MRLIKYIKQFFDHVSFLKGKKLEVADMYNSRDIKKFNGCTCVIAITNDPTGENNYEKFNVKIRNADCTKLPFKKGDEVKVTQVEEAYCYNSNFAKGGKSDWKDSLTIIGRLEKVGK